MAREFGSKIARKLRKASEDRNKKEKTATKPESGIVNAILCNRHI